MAVSKQEGLPGTLTGSTAEPVETRSGQALRQVKPWVERLARTGYAAKGIVYIAVGWLAALASLGQGGKKTNPSGALAAIAMQPFGKLLLAVLAVGLAGYALWRFVQGIADPEQKGTNAKGIAKRFGYVFSGIAYTGLAITAAKILRGIAASHSGRGASPQNTAERLLSLPLGRYLVMLIGLAIILVGLNTLYIALKEKFRDKLKWSQMSRREQQWATHLGKLGLSARAVVSGIIGYFLLQAGLQTDPKQAQGVDGALKTLAQQAQGHVVLGVVAGGLIAYGIYSFVEARYRRVLET